MVWRGGDAGATSFSAGAWAPTALREGAPGHADRMRHRPRTARGRCADAREKVLRCTWTRQENVPHCPSTPRFRPVGQLHSCKKPAAQLRHGGSCSELACGGAHFAPGVETKQRSSRAAEHVSGLCFQQTIQPGRLRCLAMLGRMWRSAKGARRHALDVAIGAKAHEARGLGLEPVTALGCRRDGLRQDERTVKKRKRIV